MPGSPQKNSGSILLIEDDTALTKSIGETLTDAGYSVTPVTSSQAAFASIFKTPPDVVILDINLPDLDGFHIARELKRNVMFRQIPMIVLSNRIDFLDKMRSLDVIMDEYLVKPIDAKDLLLRTQLVAQRAEANLDANPLTHLPGNRAIMKAITERMAEGKPFAVGYADLNNFKAFNDKYGFSNGDLLIQYTAKTLISVVEKYSPNNNFVGHVGGDDFVFICSYESANDICQVIAEQFDKGAAEFYSEEDRQKGYIVVEDRRGIVSQIPLVSIAIGMASDEGKKFTNLGQVNHALTQLKKYAKSFHGSAFVRDRRNLTAQMAEFTWGPGSANVPPKVLDQITTALGEYLPKQLSDIIKNQSISVLFQPIIDMKTDDVIGHESLVRGPAGTPLEYPDALFQTARTSNQVLPLDHLCMRKIVVAASQLHRGMKLFINVFPETFMDKNLLNLELFKGLEKRGIETVLELTGAQRANDPVEIYAELARFKAKGFRISVDATSAAFDDGLRFLTELRPHYVKLNMMPYKDMVNDFQKQTQFLKNVGLLRQTGAVLICTKLESRSDSYLALKAGVPLGQGYLFARPSQVPHTPEKPSK